MIKLSFCLVRLPHLTREAFQAYWLETHAPLVAGVAAELQIRRYVQTHALPPEAHAGLRASRSAPPEFDGVASSGSTAWRRWRKTAPAPRPRPPALRLLEDERRFIDLPKSPIFLSREHVIVG